jgi:hypothetical protein
MGQSVHCFSNSNGGCALSVQKIYFYFTDKLRHYFSKPLPGLYFSDIS